ncbi:nucleotide-diphospho-sugar transferase [Elsinoe ampelina]|uniref:glycogenin glucosyltransferase n=1 Tax=Elsinoe ampelina TaxID=302913 RepID=A0A6A6GHQ7_9PEZI|nr:nucleotide-diphospho-sugar transferase [Elsinoe ampelina]
MAIEEEAYCTLVMTDSYLPGAAVLAHSLRDSGTKKKLAALVTLETLRADTIEELKSLYDYVIPVDRIPNPNPANLYLIDRGDLLYAFTKINLWRLTQFKKVVYIDADVVALRAPDELFATKENFAAASDIGWPDFFNSGVMVLKPDMGTYWALQTLAASGDSFDGADQGLLNQYFEHKNWKRLHFTYNCTPSASYQYEPAYRYHKANISMVHFIGQSKPWQKGRTVSQKGSGAYKELVNRWWAVYDLHYKFPTYGMEGGPRSNVVKSLVTGEATSTDYGYSSVPQAQAQTHNTHHAPQPQNDAPIITIEAPPSDPADFAEQIVHEHVEPTPTVEQRRFSAPINEWDATRAPPPEASRPEAVNFPTQSYEFNADPTPYQPPQSYPEPPKDMWYEVPKEKPLPATARPKAIFPWEERPIARPTRVFIEDTITTPSTNTEAEDPGLSRSTTSDKDSEAATPTTPVIKINDELPQTMAPMTKNAWDDVAGIDTYVRQLNQWQKLRGKLQVLQSNDKSSQSPANEATNPMDSSNNTVLSPTEELDEITGSEPRSQRRESLILTQFPSADERPSLPVTPAPIKRNVFWGADKNADGSSLPAAEGVPHQADWDPNAQLEALRASSIALKPESLRGHAKNVPRRDMPRSSIDVGQHPGLVGSVASSPGDKPEHHVHFGGVVEVREVPGLDGGEKVKGEKAAGGEVKGNGTGRVAGEGLEETKGRKGGVSFGEVRFGEEAAGGRDEVVSPTAEVVGPAA